MTLTTPLHGTHLHQVSNGEGDRKKLILFSRLIRFILFFAYSTFPIWSMTLLGEMKYLEMSSSCILFAMGWLPVSAAITSLSFMKFGWKNKFKGLSCFILYNAIALGSAAYFIGF